MMTKITTDGGLADFVADRATGRDRWSIVAVGIGMTGVSIGLIIWGGPVGLVAGILGTVFFGGLGLPFVMFWAVHPVPPLLVGASGFVLQRTASDPGLVAWGEVDSIGTTVVRGFSRVVIRLRDPAAFLSRRRPVRRALLLINGVARLGNLRIPLGGMLMAGQPVQASELAAIMQARLNRAGPLAAAERTAHVDLWNRRTGLTTDSLITYQWDGQQALMSLSAPDIQTTITRYGHELFDALQQVRRDLEPFNWYPLCAGARVDCHPTTVTREAEGASSVAVLDCGHDIEPPLVGLFEAAPGGSVGTVASQEAHYRKWLNPPGPAQ
jgi:hypothetical protein